MPWLRVALVLGAIGVLAILYGHRPAGQFFYPRCSFHTLTGLWCPGCGGLRSMHELLHGNLLAAARCNLLFIVGLPLALLGWSLSRQGGRSAPVSSRAVWIGFAVVVVFTILRNLPVPAFAWMAPPP